MKTVMEEMEDKKGIRHLENKHQMAEVNPSLIITWM